MGTRYVYHACLWRKWDVAHPQFKALGDAPWPRSPSAAGESEKYKSFASGKVKLEN